MLPLHPTATCHDAPGQPEGPDPGAFMTDYDNYVPPGEFSCRAAWTVEETDACFIVRDGSRHSLHRRHRHRHSPRRHSRNRRPARALCDAGTFQHFHCR